MADLTRPQINDKSLVVSSWDSLKKLRDDTGETSQLLVMSDGKTLILEQCISNQPIKVSGQIGLEYLVIPVLQVINFAELPKIELEKYLSQITFRILPKTHYLVVHF